MPLTDFDPTKHHVGLAPAGTTLKGFSIVGGYQRAPQRYGAPQEFGGERDLIAPSVLERWTQDDFSGGAFQEVWGEDPAMFWLSENALPGVISKAIRSVPPLIYWAVPGKVDAADAIAVFGSGGKVNVVKDVETKHYNINTGAVDGTTATTTNVVQAAAHDPNDNVIYSLTKEEGGGTPDHKLRIRRYSHTLAPETVGTFNDNSVDWQGVGLEMAGRDLVAAVKNTNTGAYTLWLCDVNDARTDTEFTRLGRLPGKWRSSCAYNGIVYILCTDDEHKTTLVQWDGTQILPVTDFPYNFMGQCVTVYGGRIYVGGAGRDISGNDAYAEFYEVTGASLRTVFSYADQYRGGRSVPGTVFDLNVHEGLLFIATDQQQLLVYDLTRDSVFGGPMVVPDADTDGNLEVRHLLSTREKLFAWCNDDGGSGATSGDGFYRLVTTNAELAAGPTSFDMVIETSDFAPEPDRDKVFSQLRLLTRSASGGAGNAPTAEYSTDGGVTWTALTGASTANGAFRTTDFDLTDIDPSKVIRLRYTLSQTVVAYQELIAATVTFLSLDDGKRSWRFMVAAVDEIEAVDGTSQDIDVASTVSTLWQWFTAKTILDFTDTDGGTATVVVTDVSDQQPTIAPALPDGSREGFVSVVLTEL